MREFSPEDFEDFEAIYAVFRDVVFISTREHISEILEEYRGASDKRLFGHFRDGRLLGILGIRLGEMLEVAHLGVHPDFRRRGIGAAMLRSILGIFPDRDIFLTTDPDAVGFYRKQGFSAREFSVEKNGEAYRRFRCEHRGVRATP